MHFIYVAHGFEKENKYFFDIQKYNKDQITSIKVSFFTLQK